MGPTTPSMVLTPIASGHVLPRCRRDAAGKAARPVSAIRTRISTGSTSETGMNHSQALPLQVLARNRRT